MAFSSNGNWEIRTTGSDANGGFYASGGTDYSQQDAAQLALTDVVTAGTTTVTSVTGGFTSAMIGNGINIAGTVYQITARASVNSITVDRATGTGSGQTGNVGGACASPGFVGAFATVTGNVWVKAGTYSIGSGTVNTAGNKVAPPSGSNVTWNGYTTTRGDDGFATLQSSVTGITIFDASSQNGCTVRSLIFDGNNLSSVSGLKCSTSVNSRAINVKAINCPSNGIFNSYTLPAQYCYVSNCGNGITGNAEFCVASGCTIGFVSDDSDIPWCTLAFCIATGCGTGFKRANNHIRDSGCDVRFCTAYGSTSHGFDFGTPSGTHLSNCVSYGNGGKGFSVTINAALFVNNAAGSNTSGTDGTVIALTAAPFTNAGSGDFTPNATTGGGALLRAAAIPGTFPGGLTVSHNDIGAAQHTDSGGGSTGSRSRTQ